MSSGTIVVKGLAELQKALQTLPAKLQANVMRGALRAGAKPLMAEAKQLAPVDQGLLAASLRIHTRVKSLVAIGSVKAGGSPRNSQHAARHAHLVEYGTKPHHIEARPPNKALAIGVFSVDHPGARAHPFMRPALDAKGQVALAAMADYMRKRLKDKHGIDVPVPTEDGDE